MTRGILSACKTIVVSALTITRCAPETATMWASPHVVKSCLMRVSSYSVQYPQTSAWSTAEGSPSPASAAMAPSRNRRTAPSGSVRATWRTSVNFAVAACPERHAQSLEDADPCAASTVARKRSPCKGGSTSSSRYAAILPVAPSGKRTVKAHRDP